MQQDDIEAFFTVNQENNTRVYRLDWAAWDPRHIYFSLSTSSWSHSKQKGLPDFLVCSSHQITTSMSLHEGPDVRHMQICSRRGWSEWLVRETHIHGNTSFLAWWFLKWLIRLQQLAKEKPCSRGGHTVQSLLGIALVSISAGSFFFLVINRRKSASILLDWFLFFCQISSD